MKPVLISRNGFNIRAIKCPNCNATIIHPADQKEYENFMRLKQKEFNVKMRMVGNSYAVSIPREIVDFMHDQENLMNNMVRMCFEEAGKISMNFNTDADDENSRTIKQREVRVIKNNKPVYHIKQFSDSANPKNNQTRVFKAKELNKEEKE